MRRRFRLEKQICRTTIERRLTTSRMGASMGESAHLILVFACSFTAHTTTNVRWNTKSAWEILLDTKEWRAIRFRLSSSGKLFVQKPRLRDIEVPLEPCDSRGPRVPRNERAEDHPDPLLDDDDKKCTYRDTIRSWEA